MCKENDNKRYISYFTLNKSLKNNNCVAERKCVIINQIICNYSVALNCKSQLTETHAKIECLHATSININTNHLNMFKAKKLKYN